MDAGGDCITDNFGLRIRNTLPSVPVQNVTLYVSYETYTFTFDRADADINTD